MQNLKLSEVARAAIEDIVADAAMKILEKLPPGVGALKLDIVITDVDRNGERDVTFSLVQRGLQ